MSKQKAIALLDKFEFNSRTGKYFAITIASNRVNPYPAGTELTRFNYVNIMAADALAPYVARTSAAIILIM